MHARSRLDINMTSMLMAQRLPQHDGRPSALFHGTGRTNAVRSTDPRSNGDFGLVPSPSHQKSGQGQAMEKFDKFLRRAPRGWSESPTYVTGMQREAMAEREKAAEQRAAARRAAVEQEAQKKAAAEAARLEEERLRAQEQRDFEAELQRAREAVFSWGADLEPVHHDAAGEAL